MAGFCKFCGKQLEGEETCACQVQTVETPEVEVNMQPEIKPREGSKDFNFYKNELFTILKVAFSVFMSIMKDFIEAGSKFIECGTDKVAYTLILVNAFFFATEMCINVSVVNKFIPINFFTIFMVAFALTIAATAIYLGVIFVLNKLFRVSSNYHKCLRFIGVMSCYFICFAIVTVVSSIFGVVIQGIVMLIGVLLVISYTNMLLQSGFEMKKSTAPIINTIFIMVGTGAILLLVMKVVQTIIINAASGYVQNITSFLY